MGVEDVAESREAEAAERRHGIEASAEEEEVAEKGSV
jgi:hypothetical protein